ncbi:MAG: hypothetical protein WC497_01180 [Patescibacteria group bacterium]
MKIPTTILRTYGPKIAWLVCSLFLIWVLYSQYRVIDEAILHPPLVQENQVTARQSKINQKLLKSLKDNQIIKKDSTHLTLPTHDPFAPAPSNASVETE